MFTTLRVENFRSIRDSGNLSLSRLNIIIGPNNAGKSSLLYALLLLKQTIEDKDPQNVLVTCGPHVDLGSYLDIIRGNERQRELGIQFELDEKILPRQPVGRLLGGKTAIVGPFDKWQIRFRFNPDTNTIDLRSFRVTDSLSNSTYRGKLEETGWVMTGIPSQVRPHLAPAFNHFVPCFMPQEEEPPTERIARWAIELHLHSLRRPALLGFLFHDILYVGPIRERIPRYGILGAMPYSELGPSGQNLMRVLSRVGEEGRSEKTVLEQLDYWLDKKFKILKNVRIENIDKGGTVKALIADDPRGNEAINLAAMGSGLSQLVPVVVQTVLTPPNGCLIIEQPEIHLHPAAQANLADLFIKHAKDKRQLIIETHSEHLLLRVRRRIAEGRISPDLVRVFFVEKRGAETKVRCLDLQRNGHFERWPRGFFEEGYREAMAIAEAQSE